MGATHRLGQHGPAWAHVEWGEVTGTFAGRGEVRQAGRRRVAVIWAATVSAGTRATAIRHRGHREGGAHATDRVRVRIQYPQPTQVSLKEYKGGN